MNHDSELSSIIDFLRAISNRMAMADQDEPYCHVLNAINSLRLAHSKQHQELLAAADLERLKRLKVSA